MNETLVRRDWLGPLLIAIGMVLAGLLIGNGFARSRASTRYVTVKGVAEQNVEADLAIWPIGVLAANDNLATAQAELQSNIHGVMQFLARQQIDTSQVSLQNFSVSDALANQYNSGARAVARYVIHQTVVVRSTHPQEILAASQRVGELASAGVALSSGNDYGGSSGPTFVFTGLNQLKPKMIADATSRAREGAEQFAHDSRSSLAGIRTANQGVFEILARDGVQASPEANQIDKTVRVVSTVEYFLKD